MYIDLMSPYGMLQINIKLANLLSLECATYWSELLNIYSRVVFKKKDELIQNNGFFELDREYITKRTTLSEDTQHTCDVALSKLNVITIDKTDNSRIKIDLEKMCALITEDDPKRISQIKQAAKLKRAEAAAAKRESMVKVLFNKIDSADKDIVNALQSWILSIIKEGKKYITPSGVTIFQKNLDEYTDRKDIKLKIIEIATVHGYTDFAWSKNIYEKDYARYMGASRTFPKINGTNVNTSMSF